jgi:hypothetical protein
MRENVYLKKEFINDRFYDNIELDKEWKPKDYPEKFSQILNIVWHSKITHKRSKKFDWKAILLTLVVILVLALQGFLHFRQKVKSVDLRQNLVNNTRDNSTFDGLKTIEDLYVPILLNQNHVFCNYSSENKTNSNDISQIQNNTTTREIHSPQIVMERPKMSVPKISKNIIFYFPKKIIQNSKSLSVPQKSENKLVGRPVKNYHLKLIPRYSKKQKITIKDLFLSKANTSLTTLTTHLTTIHLPTLKTFQIFFISFLKSQLHRLFIRICTSEVVKNAFKFIVGSSLTFRR